MKHLIAGLFILTVFSCKKETFEPETGKNYFMVYFDTEIINDNLPIDRVAENTHEQAVSIMEDSIIIKEAGFYHFDAFLTLTGKRQIDTRPVLYQFVLRTRSPTKGFTIAFGTTITASNGYDYGSGHRSVEVPLAANSSVKIRCAALNVTDAIVVGNFSGYLVNR